MIACDSFIESRRSSPVLTSHASYPHISGHGNLDGGSDAGVRVRGVHFDGCARSQAAALGAVALARAGDGCGARGGDRHRSGLPRAGARREADACGRGVLHARACRPHSGHGRPAAAELYRAAEGWTDSALRRCADDGGFGAGLFVHLFAASHVSHAGAPGTEAAGGAQRGRTAWSSCAFRCCTERCRSTDIALAMRRT